MTRKLLLLLMWHLVVHLVQFAHFVLQMARFLILKAQGLQASSDCAQGKKVKNGPVYAGPYLGGKF